MKPTNTSYGAMDARVVNSAGGGKATKRGTAGTDAGMGNGTALSTSTAAQECGVPAHGALPAPSTVVGATPVSTFSAGSIYAASVMSGRTECRSGSPVSGASGAPSPVQEYATTARNAQREIEDLIRESQAPVPDLRLPHRVTGSCGLPRRNSHGADATSTLPPRHPCMAVSPRVAVLRSAARISPQDIDRFTERWPTQFTVSPQSSPMSRQHAARTPSPLARQSSPMWRRNAPRTPSPLARQSSPMTRRRTVRTPSPLAQSGRRVVMNNSSNTTSQL